MGIFSKKFRVVASFTVKGSPETKTFLFEGSFVPTLDLCFFLAEVEVGGSSPSAAFSFPFFDFFSGQS